MNKIILIKNEITQNDKNKNTQLHNFNFGFALLKNILAFDVIITHCFNKNTAHNNTILFITKRRKVHVPSFFILSFYYNYNINFSIINWSRTKSFSFLVFIRFDNYNIIIYGYNNIIQEKTFIYN